MPKMIKAELSLSVIIPTFNRADVLREALRSVYDQTVDPYEVVIVDDGSTDHTAGVVAEFDDRIQYMRQDNSGPATARNTGITKATGDLIGFLDSDDIWFPQFVESACRVFHENTGVEAVVFDNETQTLAGEFVPSRFIERGVVCGFSGPFSIDVVPPTWGTRPSFSTCCLIVRRESLRRLGQEPFDASLRAYEDWDLELRLYEHLKVLFVPRVLARVRKQSDQTQPAPEEVLRARYQVARRYCRSPYLTGDARDELRKTRMDVARALARVLCRARRRDIEALAASEVWCGSPLNAARVLKRGIWDTSAAVET